MLDFPTVPAPVPASDGLLAALGGPVPVWTGVTDNADPGERNLLAVLPSEQDVHDVTPDLQAVAALPPGGLTVSARREAGSQAAAGEDATKVAPSARRGHRT